MAPVNRDSQLDALTEHIILAPRAAELILEVPDFPEPGINFRDITPVLSDYQAMREVVDRFVEYAEVEMPDVIVGIESRGFVLGMPVALELAMPFVPVRKLGKLPRQTVREEYALEYGSNTVEIHADAIEKDQRVLIIDDLLATGGTAMAAAKLVERLGGVVASMCFMIELDFLKGKERLAKYDVLSLIHYTK